MKSKIECIYSDDYQLKQYYKKGWQCGLGDDDVPMTIAVEVIDMYGATGESEFKNYNYVVSIGIVNLNIHESIKAKLDGDSLSDLIGYYGMNCYIDQQLLDTDLINEKLIDKLSIGDASLVDYTDRFTGKTKQTVYFKTETAAFDFAEKLINAYGDMIMTLIGFTLDRPVNLVGETGWRQTETLHKGE